MPVTVCDKKYLMESLGFDVTDDELVRNINNLGLNVKKIDDELEIEYNADRPDVISAIGLARAVRYFMRKSRDFDYGVGKEEEGFVIGVGGHARARPYISSLVVRKMKLGEDGLKDIINFTDKLSETYGRKRSKIAIGLHDLRKVKPPFEYDAYEDEEFVPLGSKSKMKYSEVLKKAEKGIAYGHLLSGSGRRFFAIKDSVGTMALVPIINSERTRVTEATTDIIIDITGTSKYVLEKVADMLAANFKDMGCEVHKVCVKYGTKSYLLPKMETKTISIPVEQINRELGVTIGFNNAILLANKMGYDAALIGRNIRFTVPAYRLDVINEQDVIEDIAIAYGYDYIQPIAVPAVTEGSLEDNSRIMRLMGETMVGLGFTEEIGSYLTNEESNFTRMRTKDGGEAIRIANPKTTIATMFRTWITPSLLKDLALSMHDRLPQRLFELDMAFCLKNNKPVEAHHLAAVICDAKVNINDMKSAFESFAGALGLDCRIARGIHPSTIEGRCAELFLGKERVGFIGEIHPEVLLGFGIEEPVTAFEIDLSGWLADDGKRNRIRAPAKSD